MNKSIFTLVLVLILFCMFLTAENENCGKFRLGVNFGYFSFKDSNDVIERINPEYLTGIFYGGDAGFMIMENIELTASYSRIHKEQDALDQIPPMPSRGNFVDWWFGVYYHFIGICEPINIKIGAGLDYCTLFGEINNFGTWIIAKDQEGFGYWFSAGVESAITEIFNVGMEIIYLSMNTQEIITSPSAKSTDLGGIRVKGSIKIRL